jgi:hypothetical protein
LKLEVVMIRSRMFTALFTRSPLTGWTYVLGKAHPAR